ncbi:MAG: 4Fe-4S binding protein [Pseudomonadota bacterium]
MSLRIDETQCTVCAMCEPLCPTESIRLNKGMYAIDAATCTECEGEYDSPQCLDSCPVDGCIVQA